MKKIYIILLLILTTILVSCQKQETYDIVSSSFIEQDIIENVVKDKLKTKSIVKPGIDLHDFSPTSKQINMIKNAKLFTFTSYHTHHWLNNNASSIVGKETKILNLEKSVDSNLNDLHYWTDPLIFIDFIEVITNEIIKIDQINKSFYINNANNYINEINLVHDDFLSFKNNHQIKIYFAGHNSMKYFENRYDIKIISLNDTDKPDADLTSKQISNLINLIKENNIKYLFIEELIDPKIAKTIQRELKSNNYELELLLLHGYHNISVRDSKNNITYLDLFKNNISNIKKAVK